MEASYNRRPAQRTKHRGSCTLADKVMQRLVIQICMPATIQYLETCAHMENWGTLNLKNKQAILSRVPTDARPGRVQKPPLNRVFAGCVLQWGPTFGKRVPREKNMMNEDERRKSPNTNVATNSAQSRETELMGFLTAPITTRLGFPLDWPYFVQVP